MGFGVVEIQELRENPTTDLSTLKITLELPKGVSYQVAQNIVLYPQNSHQKVKKALDYLNIDAEGLVLIDWEGKAKLPFDNLRPLCEVLYNYVDMHKGLK